MRIAVALVVLVLVLVLLLMLRLLCVLMRSELFKHFAQSTRRDVSDASVVMHL
jgi:hypothetical protein